MGWQPASVKPRLHPFINVLPMAGLQTQAQNGVVAAEAEWLPKPNYLPSVPLRKKFAGPCSKIKAPACYVLCIFQHFTDLP